MLDGGRDARPRHRLGEGRRRRAETRQPAPGDRTFARGPASAQALPQMRHRRNTPCEHDRQCRSGRRSGTPSARARRHWRRPHRAMLQAGVGAQDPLHASRSWSPVPSGPRLAEGRPGVVEQDQGPLGVGGERQRSAPVIPCRANASSNGPSYAGPRPQCLAPGRALVSRDTEHRRPGTDVRLLDRYRRRGPVRRAVRSPSRGWRPARPDRTRCVPGGGAPGPSARLPAAEDRAEDPAQHVLAGPRGHDLATGPDRRSDRLLPARARPRACSSACCPALALGGLLGRARARAPGAAISRRCCAGVMC